VAQAGGISDSSIDLFALMTRPRELGLDGIVITEHDVQWPEHELAQRVEGLTVLSGAEASTREGHFWLTACRT
jgi:hypothetical protein